MRSKDLATQSKRNLFSNLRTTAILKKRSVYTVEVMCPDVTGMPKFLITCFLHAGETDI